jgi:hypothetical protein
MGTWTNADGLRIAFGTDEAVTGKAGEYRTVGSERMVEVQIDLTTLGTSAAIQDQHVTIPAGAFISKVELITLVTATSSGTGTLNVGLQRLDRSTELDYDGFIAAAVLTTFNNVGETVTYAQDTTGHGALLGTELANPGYITADYDTGAFQTGVVRVRIFYMPNVI